MIVIDCSIVMAFSLPDKRNNFANTVLKKLSQDKERAIVPAIFFMECSNVLLSAYRQKRIDQNQWQDYVDAIASLPIEVDHFCASPEAMSDLSSLSKQHDLTIYDAAYLELALRKKIPLATLNNQLKLATTKALELN